MATEITHLYRGAPAVRSWSRYQETVPWWTLCGSEYDPENGAASATEDG